MTPTTPTSPDLDAIYAEARRALLDALTALAPYGSAVVLAGAQAVYLRTGDADLAVAPYTTDGDLALDPRELVDEPVLEEAMRSAGFALSTVEGHPEPGIWVTNGSVNGEEVLIPVDLIVPETAHTGGGTRGARLGVHGNRAARRAVGLEAALIDHDTMTIAALDPLDTRSIDVEVAGAAALLVAKAHKLHDRLASKKPGRADDKDAADVLRLFQTTSPERTAQTLNNLMQDPLAGVVTTEAMAYLADLFSRRGSDGVTMAARALRVGLPERQVETLSVSYMGRLREGVEVRDA